MLYLFIDMYNRFSTLVLIDYFEFIKYLFDNSINRKIR
jgi:hypothetical protein